MDRTKSAVNVALELAPFEIREARRSLCRGGMPRWWSVMLPAAFAVSLWMIEGDAVAQTASDYEPPFTFLSAPAWCADSATVCWDPTGNWFNGVRFLGEMPMGAIRFDGAWVETVEPSPATGIELSVYRGWVSLQSSRLWSLPDVEDPANASGWQYGVAMMDGFVATGIGTISDSITAPWRGDLFAYFYVQPISVTRSTVKHVLPPPCKQCDPCVTAAASVPLPGLPEETEAPAAPISSTSVVSPTPPSPEVAPPPPPPPPPPSPPAAVATSVCDAGRCGFYEWKEAPAPVPRAQMTRQQAGELSDALREILRAASHAASEITCPHVRPQIHMYKYRNNVGELRWVFRVGFDQSATAMDACVRPLTKQEAQASGSYLRGRNGILRYEVVDQSPCGNAGGEAERWVFEESRVVITSDDGSRQAPDAQPDGTFVANLKGRTEVGREEFAVYRCRGNN